ncbi:MAG TPA: hypothetical protein PLO23_07655 [Alphaproteobacteria bacterium]|nr:hypothetical protein [Alphaproteobacteria bacterium]
MRLLIAALALMLLAAPASAEELSLDGEILQEPICFMLRNTAEHKVYGTFSTNYYVTPDGTQARHRSNFQLDQVGAKDAEGYPADAAEFCSYGPFFEGRKLELVLRTLFPIFDCYTKVDAGEIVIKSKRNASDSGFDVWECRE